YTINCSSFFFFQAEDGIRDRTVTGVQTCALPISPVAAPAIFAADHPANPKAIAVAVLRIIRHPGSGSAHPRGAVLAMGNFDGLRSEERRVGKEWRSWKWGG